VSAFSADCRHIPSCRDREFRNNALCQVDGRIRRLPDVPSPGSTSVSATGRSVLHHCRISWQSPVDFSRRLTDRDRGTAGDQGGGGATAAALPGRLDWLQWIDDDEITEPMIRRKEKRRRNGCCCCCAFRQSVAHRQANGGAPPASTVFCVKQAPPSVANRCKNLPSRSFSTDSFLCDSTLSFALVHRQVPICRAMGLGDLEAFQQQFSEAACARESEEGLVESSKRSKQKTVALGSEEYFLINSHQPRTQL
jgi:hypothetical protein